MIPNGRLIKAARAYLGWTQDDLAEAAHLHPNAVAYWEAKAEINNPPHEVNGAPHRMEQALKTAGVVFTTKPALGIAVVSGTQFPTISRARTREGHPETA